MDILTWENFDWANVTHSVYSTIMIDFESVIPGKSEAKKKKLRVRSIFDMHRTEVNIHCSYEGYKREPRNMISVQAGICIWFSPLSLMFFI